MSFDNVSDRLYGGSDKPKREEKTGSCCFRRKEHLKGRKEIRRVFSEGRRYNCHLPDGCGSRLFVLKNDLPYYRICFTFSRGSHRFFNAVSRNRVKRLDREVFRLLKGCFVDASVNGGFDFILLVYPQTGKPVTLSERKDQLEFLFKKAGLLK